MLTLTLAQIKKHKPCEDGWRELLKSLGGMDKYGKDTPVTFEQIIKSNGLDDAFWALRCLGEEHQGWIRHYAVDCAESVKHLMEDERSLKALEVARRYADGKASENELDAARYVARNSSWDEASDDVCGAARSAVWSAACTDATDAARLAARTSALAFFRAADCAADMASSIAGLEELLIEYTRTGKRVMNAQEIIKKHNEKQ